MCVCVCPHSDPTWVGGGPVGDVEPTEEDPHSKDGCEPSAWSVGEPRTRRVVVLRSASNLPLDPETASVPSLPVPTPTGSLRPTLFRSGPLRGCGSNLSQGGRRRKQTYTESIFSFFLSLRTKSTAVPRGPNGYSSPLRQDSGNYKGFIVWK